MRMNSDRELHACDLGLQLVDSDCYGPYISHHDRLLVCGDLCQSGVAIALSYDSTAAVPSSVHRATAPPCTRTRLTRSSTARCCSPCRRTTVRAARPAAGAVDVVVERCRCGLTLCRTFVYSATSCILHVVEAGCAR